MTKSRELWIDYTKMFACILVVMGHLLQGLNVAGIHWNERFYSYINTFLYIFHMPLFMCLSGYLYKKYAKINSWKEYFKFLKKKLINLGIPYVVFYLAFVLINMMFASSVNSKRGLEDILNILTNPMPPFWFLYALFFIFLVTPLLEKLLRNNRIIVLIITIVMHSINIFYHTEIYAIDIVEKYLVYFYLGAFLIDKVKDEYKNKNIIIETISFICLSLVYCYIIEENIMAENGIMAIFKFLLAILGVVASIQVCTNLTNIIKKRKVLNLISKNTFPIYLMHTMFSAGIRIVLLKLGVINFYLHFVLGLILGIFGPIIVAIILEKTKYGNFVLYPLKTVKQIKEQKE